MKTTKNLFAIFALIAMASIYGSAQASEKPQQEKYDAELAKRLGGNDNGMRMYVLCILKTGPKDAEFKGKERDDIFAGHMSNIGRMADAGQLAIAGPFGKNDKTWRGLYIFAVDKVEDAEKIVVSDPAVKAGVFVYDLVPWFGSAALMITNDTHKRITKPTK